MTDFLVPGPSGEATLTVSPGRPVFIVGRNGTGKSALVQRLNQEGRGRVTYLPGNRTSIFDGEGLNMTPVTRKNLTNNLMSWDNSTDARWRNQFGNQRNERAIHDLTLAEIQYKNDLANAIANNTDVDTSIGKLQAPLDRVNLLLEQANIPVRMLILEGELQAKADANTFSSPGCQTASGTH